MQESNASISRAAAPRHWWCHGGDVTTVKATEGTGTPPAPPCSTPPPPLRVHAVLHATHSFKFFHRFIERKNEGEGHPCLHAQSFEGFLRKAVDSNLTQCKAKLTLIGTSKSVSFLEKQRNIPWYKSLIFRMASFRENIFQKQKNYTHPIYTSIYIILFSSILWLLNEYFIKIVCLYLKSIQRASFTRRC